MTTSRPPVAPNLSTTTTTTTTRPTPRYRRRPATSPPDPPLVYPSSPLRSPDSSHTPLLAFHPQLSASATVPAHSARSWFSYDLHVAPSSRCSPQICLDLPTPTLTPPPTPRRPPLPTSTLTSLPTNIKRITGAPDVALTNVHRMRHRRGWLRIRYSRCHNGGVGVAYKCLQ